CHACAPIEGYPLSLHDALPILDKQGQQVFAMEVIFRIQTLAKLPVNLGSTKYFPGILTADPRPEIRKVFIFWNVGEGGNHAIDALFHNHDGFREVSQSNN